ncbi:type II toxin-antitoxin system PemK/MazF family toxin [Haloferax gibbonsii]|uniref:type II toxin-antitoxin system PemK/MazF family toxin n=1 Tax=Haloferax gibbonsii TaxID=35746 RepID=UPI0012E2F427|nr:type II toxin-antitoxin system PemK/MazF family toxin [Haloferax gibbonsii]
MSKTKFDRGEVVSLADPYGNNKPRSAVIVSDGRRPLHNDGEMRYNVVMLSSKVGEFGGHDWAQTLDAQSDTENNQELLSDSVVEPWGTFVVNERTLNGPHAKLNSSGMKKVARALANMVLR